jgi:hypothetical protein
LKALGGVNLQEKKSRATFAFLAGGPAAEVTPGLIQTLKKGQLACTSN